MFLHIELFQFDKDSQRLFVFLSVFLDKKTVFERTRLQAAKWSEAIKPCNTHCPIMEMNEEKLSKFQFHFPVLLVPCPTKKKLSKKTFVFGLPR